MDTRYPLQLTEALDVLREFFWYAKVNDDEDDGNYLNGDSDKYPGNAWDDLGSIIDRAGDALAKADAIAHPPSVNNNPEIKR